MLAAYAFSSYPPAYIDETDSNAVANPARLLLKDPDAEFIYVMKCTPAKLRGVLGGISLPYPVGAVPLAGLSDDDSEKGVDTVYWSDAMTSPTSESDIPANTLIPQRLTNAINYQSSIPYPGTIGGRGSVSIGAIEFANPDGGIDDVLVRSWANREIEICIGGTINKGRANEKTLLLKEYQTLLKGRVLADPEQDETGGGIIPIKNPDVIFARPIQANKYAGTGGNEGGDNLKGQPKPLGYGQIRNVSPPAVDETNSIYQLHDGQIESVDSVRVKGVAYTSDGDTSDLSTWTPVASKYKTNISSGLIKVGFDTADKGQVTVDFKGDSSGGYIDTAAAIVRRIATTKTSLNDPDDIDAVAFLGSEVDAPYTIGYWSGINTLNIDEALTSIMSSIDGWWTFTRSGALTVGVHKDPQTETAKTILTESTIDEDSIQMRAAPKPIWRYAVGYKKMWTTQTPDDLADAVSVSDKSTYSQEYRYVSTQNISTRDMYRDSQDITLDSLIDDSADADTLSSTMLARDRRPKRLFLVRKVRELYQQNPGDIVTLKLPRFGLDGGRNGVVISVSENAESHEVDMEILINV